MVDELKNCVLKENITPAEAVVLAAAHFPVVGQFPLYNVEVVSEIERRPLDEVKRLRAVYGKAKVNALFPGAIPQLPSTFEEAAEAVKENIGTAGSGSGAAELLGSTADYDALAAKSPGKAAVDA